MGREEVLKLLDEEIITNWMELRRRECIVEGLKSLVANSRTKGTKKWLDGWSSRWKSAVSDKQVAEVVNSKSDWDKLKSLKYGEDELLHMCDPNNIKRGAIHIVCTEMYAEEIRALSGIQVVDEDDTTVRVRQHFDVLKRSTKYQEALSGQVNWARVNIFFATAVEQMEDYDCETY
ncbi:hypothetical protein V7S43_009391 [Phytophthora oleae]|uniref:Uncharacterized protein n=1 Tax=Phytophthora oleae TaxID=2107226 RepID=A0ABD3FG15_9STRA